MKRWSHSEKTKAINDKRGVYNITRNNLSTGTGVVIKTGLRLPEGGAELVYSMDLK